MHKEISSSNINKHTYNSTRKARLFRSIKNRLILFSLCISLIPIASITTIYYFNGKRLLMRHQLNELPAIAESKKLHLLTFMEMKKERTIDFSSDGFIKDSLEKINRGEFLNDDTVNALNKHLSLNKIPLDSHIVATAIVNTDGKVVASTNEKWIGKDMTDMEVFTQIIDKSHMTYVVQPPYIHFLDKKCICVSAPIISRSRDETIGVIINAYDLAALNYITNNRTGMGETGEVMLGRREGDNIVLLSSTRYIPKAPLSVFIPVDAAEAVPMKLAIDGGGGVIIAPDYRKVDVVAAYRNIPSLQWGLVAKIDKAEVFKPLRELGIVALLAGIVSSIIAIIVGIIFAVSTSRPIIKLKVATERFADGDMDYRVNIDPGSEIGDLARAFNFMATKTAKNIAEREDLMDFSTLMRDETEEGELIKHMTQVLKKHFQPHMLAVLMLDKKKNVIDVPIIGPPMPMDKLLKHEVLLDPSLCRVLRTGHEFIVRDINKDLPVNVCVIRWKMGGMYAFPCLWVELQPEWS